MSPKEKAESLVREYSDITLNVESDDYVNQYTAKECALIAANEVLGYMGADRGTEFWLEVRSEIEKL